MSKHCPFEPEMYYHLYNHAVGEENLFRSPENFRFFLQRYAHFAQPIVKTYAYCLMPNHFHFLILVRSYHELKNFFESREPHTERQIFSSKPISNQIGQTLGNWLNSYTKAFNKQHNRRGRLFVERIRRIKITNEAYFRQLVKYVHWNPVHHGFVQDPADWEFSSFPGLLSSPEPFISAGAILDLFGGSENFSETHRHVSAGLLFEEFEEF